MPVGRRCADPRPPERGPALASAMTWVESAPGDRVGAGHPAQGESAREPMIRMALCREQDVAALMRFIDAEWQTGHVLSRDEGLLRWQFDRRLLPGREFPGPTVMLAWQG